ncbi:MAG TPA: amino acid permease [Actinomycetes bacterium]
MAFIPGFSGLNLGLAPILSERLGLSLSKTSILVVVVVLTLSQFLINLARVKIASRINNVAAFTAELAASIVLTLILLVVGFIINRENSLSFLTSSEGVPTGGFLSAFLLSGLLGIWVLTGFEGAADLAEETKMARHRVPRSVVVSLLISIVIGFLMIVGLTINISDLGATLAAPVPMFGGLPREDVPLDPYRIHHHELTLRGSYHHTPAAIRQALALLAGGAYPFAELLTHTYPLERVAEPLAQAAGLTARDDHLLKAVIRP